MPISPQELAEQRGLKPTTSRGESAWCGPNPFEEGATDDGFLMFPNGTALDRSTEKFYSGWEIAKLAELRYDEYTPLIEYINKNPNYKPNASRKQQPAAPRPPIERKPKIPKAPKTFDTRTLEERGYTPQTMAHFQIASTKDSKLGLHYDYPAPHLDGSGGCKRRKWVNPNKQLNVWPDQNPAKYWWLQSDKSKPTPVIYNHAVLAPSARRVWLVNGEPSVWACHQNGIAAICALGEKRRLEELLNIVVGRGVAELHYVPDNDSTGYTAALKLIEIAKKVGLRLIVHQWHKPPTELKKSYDICDLWEECQKNKIDFAEMLNDLPTGLPKPVETRTVGPKSAFGARSETQFEMPAPCGEKTVEAQSESLLGLFDMMNLKTFKTDDKIPLMSIEKDGQLETIVVGSSEFGHLSDEIWDEYGAPTLKKETIDTVARKITGRAIRKGETITMSPRIMGKGEGTQEKIYIDLCNDSGEVVEVTKRGWKVIIPTDEKIFFRRSPGMKPLPAPVHTPIEKRWDTWDEFKKILAIGDEAGFVMCISWVLGCLRPPVMPYAALCVSGFQNSGKTEKCRMLRALFDPHTDDMGSVPDTNRELAVQAKNRFVLGYDNLSGITAQTSDALCRIATKGGFSTRKLHTNDEEMIFSAIRPLLINGISEYMGRDDFQRRCLFVSIPKMERRLSVRMIWGQFHQIAPRVLGLLLDAVSAAIAHSEDEEVLELDSGEGFADMAQWITGAEIAGAVPWPDGEFMHIYQQSQTEAAEAGLDALLPATFSRFARYLRESEQSEWKGTATELFEALQPHAAIILLGESLYNSADVDEKGRLMERGRDLLRRSKDFPRNFQYLANETKRLAPRMGQNKTFDVQFLKHKRHIRLKLFNLESETLELSLGENDPFED
jgi:hypothetical protein